MIRTLTDAQLLRLARAWASDDDWGVSAIYVDTLEWLIKRRAAGESIAMLGPNSDASARALSADRAASCNVNGDEL